MYKIENIEIKIHYNEKNKNIISVHFVNLEIEIENELFILTSDKNRFLTYDLNRSEIFEKYKIFSFVNGKEYLVNPFSLFVSKNKILLEREIRYKIKEMENKNYVSEIEIEELIEELINFNKKTLDKVYLNMIDIALDNNDKEMFEEVLEAKSKFIKC